MPTDLTPISLDALSASTTPVVPTADDRPARRLSIAADRHRPGRPAGRWRAVHVGLFDGPPGGQRTRHPVGEDAAFRPFWDTYHTITSAMPAARSTARPSIQGAIRGMIDALGDPYSSYLTSQEYRDSLQGISGEFEGIGAEIATQDAEWRPGLRDARARLPAGHRRADRRLAGRDGRPPGGRSRARCRRDLPRRPGCGRRTGPYPRPAGQRGRPVGRARRRAGIRPRDHPRRHPAATRSSRPTRRRDDRLRPAERVLRSRRRGAGRCPAPPTWRPDGRG